VRAPAPPAGISRGGALFWLGCMAAGVWVRLSGLTAMPFFGDEYHTLGTLELGYGETLRLFDTVGSHVALPLIQKVSADLFGPGIAVNRLVALVPGLLTLALLFPLGRPLVGAPASLVATAALALSPMHVFYSRFARGYALSVLLALLLVDAVRRATAGPGPAAGSARRHWAAVTLWVALLPYVHLSSLGLIAGVGLVAAGLAWRRDGARGLLAPVASFAAGGLLCALLYLPAQETLRAYLSSIQGEGFTEALGPLDVPAILAGGRAAGAVLLAGVPLAALWMARSGPGRAALCLAPIAGPLLFTLVFKPNGMAYAYARYMMAGLPFMLLLLGWLLATAVRPARSAVVVGAGLVLALYVTGPLSPLQPDNGPYDNTYLSMGRLPAFDVPFVETPEFYRRLASDDSVTRIIEAPPIGSRAVLLYRNYYLQHGKQTVFGLLTPSNETLVRGPYVRVFDKQLDESSGAQYLVVHTDATTEVARYWSYVYHFVWPADPDPSLTSYMTRQLLYLDPPGPLEPKMLRPLSRRFGKPVYEDGFIKVWDLRHRVDGDDGESDLEGSGE